ncbi:hypothetical protein BDF19DRAFT_417983 [Syncephalis fuscata]|nr:hypothetical protein BDF19DRAFT_417983 [Syncephalis fuscata]
MTITVQDEIKANFLKVKKEYADIWKRQEALDLQSIENPDPQSKIRTMQFHTWIFLASFLLDDTELWPINWMLRIGDAFSAKRKDEVKYIISKYSIFVDIAEALAKEINLVTRHVTYTETTSTRWSWHIGGVDGKPFYGVKEKYIICTVLPIHHASVKMMMNISGIIPQDAIDATFPLRGDDKNIISSLEMAKVMGAILLLSADNYPVEMNEMGYSSRVHSFFYGAMSSVFKDKTESSLFNFSNGRVHMVLGESKIDIKSDIETKKHLEKLMLQCRHAFLEQKYLLNDIEHCQSLPFVYGIYAKAFCFRFFLMTQESSNQLQFHEIASIDIASDSDVGSISIERALYVFATCNNIASACKQRMEEWMEMGVVFNKLKILSDSTKTVSSKATAHFKRRSTSSCKDDTENSKKPRLIYF